MKKILLSILLLLSASAAVGQVTNVSPQSVSASATQLNLNGVSAPTASPCITNVGQTVHFLFYQETGATGAPTGVQIRLEGSFNSDSATCVTGTWFPISDDGTEISQNAQGLVLGIGNYPFLRVNLAKCTTCDVADTITANYVGTSAIPENPFGLYGAGQQIRKVLFTQQTQSGTITAPTINSPYGSTAGYIVISASANFTGGTLVARCFDFGAVSTESSLTLTGGGSTLLPVPAMSCTAISVRCNSCTGAGNYTGYYYFYPPGAAQPAAIQPANTNNAETTAVNATASVTFTLVAGNVFQRAHVFSISGRCSAGTSQLLVVDTTASVNLWTSAATEVGTTTFRFQWNPSLAGAVGHTVQVQLTTCGVANTGTLDVQGSIL